MAHTAGVDAGELPLDVRGLACPLPFLLARRRLADMVPGQTLSIIAADVSIAEELADLCEATRSVLIADGCSDGVYAFRIIKPAA